MNLMLNYLGIPSTNEVSVEAGATPELHRISYAENSLLEYWCSHYHSVLFSPASAAEREGLEVSQLLPQDLASCTSFVQVLCHCAKKLDCTVVDVTERCDGAVARTRSDESGGQPRATANSSHLTLPLGDVRMEMSVVAQFLILRRFPEVLLSRAEGTVEGVAHEGLLTPPDDGEDWVGGVHTRVRDLTPRAPRNVVLQIEALIEAIQTALTAFDCSPALLASMRSSLAAAVGFADQLCSRALSALALNIVWCEDMQHRGNASEQGDSTLETLRESDDRVDCLRQTLQRIMHSSCGANDAGDCGEETDRGPSPAVRAASALASLHVIAAAFEKRLQHVCLSEYKMNAASSSNSSSEESSQTNTVSRRKKRKTIAEFAREAGGVQDDEQVVTHPLLKEECEPSPGGLSLADVADVVEALASTHYRHQSFWSWVSRYTRRQISAASLGEAEESASEVHALVLSDIRRISFALDYAHQRGEFEKVMSCLVQHGVLTHRVPPPSEQLTAMCTSETGEGGNPRIQ